MGTHVTITPETHPDYFITENGVTRRRTYDERRQHEADLKRRQDELNERAAKLSPKSQDPNQYRERLEYYERRATEALSLAEQQEAKRRVTFYKPLVAKTDKAIEQEKLERDRVTHPDYLWTMENVQSLERSYGAMFPHAPQELIDTCVAISRSDLPPTEMRRQYGEALQAVYDADIAATNKIFRDQELEQMRATVATDRAALELARKEQARHKALKEANE